MIRDNRHDSAYIFGAICPDRAVGAAIIAPTANTECMNLQPSGDQHTGRPRLDRRVGLR